MLKVKLAPGENLIGIFRQTSVFLFRYCLVALLILIIPWTYLNKYELTDKLRGILWFFALLIAFLMARKFLLWLLNCYVLTNNRILKFHYIGIFHKKITEVQLDKIVNINLESKGFFTWLFKYGNVNLQIFGLNEPVILERINNPLKIKEQIKLTAQK